jgi:hypothetical protein
MMDKETHDSPEANAIRQRMDAVHRDLDKDVQEIVQGTRDIRDWRAYVSSYPWACVGAAIVIGYWIAPRRSTAMQPNREMLTALAKQSCAAAKSELPTKSNASGVALSFLSNLVLREVASYVGQRAGEFIAARTVKSQQDEQP